MNKRKFGKQFLYASDFTSFVLVFQTIATIWKVLERNKIIGGIILHRKLKTQSKT